MKLIALFVLCLAAPGFFAALRGRTVFRRWTWFAGAWTILSLIAIALTPETIHSFFTAFPWVRAHTIFATSVLQVLISAVVIFWPARKNAPIHN